MKVARFVSKAIANLRPGALWSLENEDPEKLTWNDETQTKPTLQEIYDECDRIENDIKKNEYKVNRVKEYPSIGDQLDDLFHSGAFSKEMIEKIQAIKDKYPKGS